LLRPIPETSAGLAEAQAGDERQGETRDGCSF